MLHEIKDWSEKASIIFTLFKSDEEAVLICLLNNQTHDRSISLYGGS